ncbi:MAG: type I-F CRISPR-associated endoribonuclease Cas6/Csy4 [Reinekea sp.]
MESRIQAKVIEPECLPKGLIIYMELTSGSNGHKHRRYIELGPLQDRPLAGEFDQFGLSKTATIAWV